MDQIICEIKHEPEYIISDNEDSDNLQIDEQIEIFECSICDKEFSYRNQLEYHKKVHAFPKRKKVREGLKNVQNVLRNAFLETDSNKFHKCTICGKGFKTFFYAKSHIALHFCNESTKCSYCGKYFASKSSRIIHEKGHNRS